MTYKIIDNFLDEELYELISQDLKSSNVPWYLREKDVTYSNTPKNKNGYFSFCYYNDFKPDHELFYTHMGPVLKKLNVLSLLQIRANLTFRDQDSKECEYHIDCDSDKLTTAILYLTSCNAKTVLLINNKEVFIDSVENRIVLFPAKTQHKVIYQTDVHKRYIINFNFLSY
jgi:hypothetical protein